MRHRLTTGLPFSLAYIRMCSYADTFPMLAMTAPYTEFQSHAIPFGVYFPDKQRCLRVALADMQFPREDEPLSPQPGKMCSRTRFFIIETPKNARSSRLGLRTAKLPSKNEKGHCGS